MLQENINELRLQLLDDIVPAKEAIAEMQAMGYHTAMIKLALQHSLNDVDSAVESLIKMQQEGTYDTALTDLLALLAANNVELESASSEEGAVGGAKRSKSNRKICEELKAKTLEVSFGFSKIFDFYISNQYRSFAFYYTT